MNSKYALEDQLYILYENRIRLCIVNEIIKNNSSIWYKVVIDSQDEEEPGGILLQYQEMNLHKSVDDLLKSLVEDFNRSMNSLDERNL